MKRAKTVTPEATDGRTATGQPSPSGQADGTVDAAVLEEILEALVAARDGDFSRRLSRRRQGVVGEIGAAYNELVTMNGKMEKELGRMRRVIGREGRMDQRASLGPAGGGWEASVESLNALIDDLVRPTTEVARVLDAVADGDLDRKMALTIEGQPVKGEFLRIGTTVNTMVDQLSSFADEVTRVAREVGTEGSLGGQAEVKGVSGTWRDLTESVNLMADNLTEQVRGIAEVTTAVARGDLSKKITVEAKGEVAALADTINTMVDQLSSFADEVTRVAREVGTEGKLGGQAEVEGVSGTWRDLTENVNSMASNLTDQVRNISYVAQAVARGDLTQKITVEAKGEVAELADTMNEMTDTLAIFADQVTSVSREVGTEGKLGGQAEVPNVSGTWKDLTESVNLMANNLTDQVRNIAQVTTAVAEGDLTQKVTVDVKGEILELKETVNTMVDQLSSFADEVTRVAREVGTEGKLGGQAEVKGVSGTWRGLTESVNLMANNLTDQVRSIAQVSTAVAEGDLSQKIAVEAKGEVAALADTINKMVDRLRSFAAEVTRVAREVGTEGKLGGQAEVEDVSGTWRGLTENVNSMASNLTDQVRNIAEVTTAVANGDLSKKITVDAQGEILELKSTVNTMVDQLNAFAGEVTRVSKEVGTDGKLGGQAEVEGVSGTWRSLTESVNFMASNLTDQVRSIADVTTAVANGDLSKKIMVDAKGEILELKNTINTMVDQLNSFAAEVTRVAREVGTEGSLGGQAEVAGVSGTWRGLTESVNSMASNLTDQVRNISQVAQAVARGDLTQKITVDAKGEILELKETLNTMVDQLSSFADEVTRVAKEVGTEGKLGGQAQVEGVSGTWRGLTENVNQLASNLTTQVRAIAEVSTAVTQGDLTRSITVEARGEVADLSDNINQMIANLRETTRQNEEQDWLKTNLARISGLMQGQRDLETVSQLIMSELSPAVSALHGAFFIAEFEDEEQGYELRLLASYGYTRRRSVANRFRVGEGLVGQAALEKKPILINDPPAEYIHISSGLGEAAPRKRDRDPGAVRGAGAGRDRAGVVPALQRDHPAVPRSADRDDRSRPLDDHRQHAYRAAPAAVSVPGAGATTAVAGTPGPAGGAAADQRGAPGEGGAARAPEPRHRDQEPRDRDRAPLTRGEGGAARAQLEVQVGVPGEHVARAAYAAQLAPDPVQGAELQRDRQPHQQAGGLGRDDPQRGLGPARAHQRHPRPVQGRGRQDGRPRRADLARGRARLRGALVPAAGRGEGAVVRDRDRAREPGQHRDRRAAAPAGPQEPPVERVQVHGARLGQAVDRPRTGASCSSPARDSRTPAASSRSRSPTAASASRRTSSG